MDLLMKALEQQVDQRISLEEFLAHPFMLRYQAMHH
jgi:hypothetical protein